MGIIPTQAISSWFPASLRSHLSSLHLTSLEYTQDSTLQGLSPPSSPSTIIETHPENSYGLSSAAFAALVADEYPSLQSSELVHLDHAASPPPPISSISAFASAISSTIYSNPHSHLPTQRAIDRTRGRVMRVLFNLREQEQEGWDLVWTSGTTASLKLIAERFPWNSNATYRYTKESHTSLVGIRACALTGGAAVESLSLDAFLSPSSDPDNDGYVLNAYPAQCNVTGSRLGLHPALILSHHIKDEGQRKHKRSAVLVDAAAYLSTSPLDLSNVDYHEAPDFIVGSFYKIYGHPTGLGFLLLKRSSAHFLVSNSRSQNFFGGGAIDALSVSSPYWVHPRRSKEGMDAKRVAHEQLENGTIPYLNIVALDCAMSIHQQLFTPRPVPGLLADGDPAASLCAVRIHAQFLADTMRREMESLEHWDGTHLVKIHRGEGSMQWEDDGPTIAFTLCTPIRKDERSVGHIHLGNLATVANIQLRTGGLCNTGVLARVSGLGDGELQSLWEQGRVCGDGQEFGGDTGVKPLGLARVSFGAPSTIEDVRKFVEFLRRYFLVSKEVYGMATSPDMGRNQSNPILSNKDDFVYLESLVRYPIKSCAGQIVMSCRLTETGLLHDREFMIINSTTGRVMSQKQFPRMALIKPFIDDDDRKEVMIIKAEGMPNMAVPLKEQSVGDVEIQARGDMAASYRPLEEADEWLSKFLGVPCQLHRFAQPSPSVSACSARLPTVDGEAPAPILFSNESPFTLISTSSVGVVNDWITSDSEGKGLVESQTIRSSCFRANFTISSHVLTSLPAFHEDNIHHIRIGTQTFQFLARCRRCLMICVDQDTGVRMMEPFGCLARHRRNGRRRVEFGVHMLWREELSECSSECSRRDQGLVGRLSVGDKISWTSVE